MDRRLQNYIRDNRLLLDLTQGGTVECDGKTAKLIGPNGVVLQQIRPIPAFINGKFIEEVTLEEFLGWESLHGMESEGGFDQGEGGDG